MAVVIYTCHMTVRTYLPLLCFLSLAPFLSSCTCDQQAPAKADPVEQPPFPVPPDQGDKESAARQATAAKSSPVAAPGQVGQGVKEAEPPPPERPRGSYEGIAQNARMGAVLIGEDGARHWVDLDAWPDSVVGKKVQLDAVPVIRYDLPVATVGPNGEQSAGVPIEPGQTAEDAARREVLTDPIWKASD